LNFNKKATIFSLSISSILILGFLTIPSSVEATDSGTHTFVGIAGGGVDDTSWDEDTNWDTGTVPSLSTDIVVIPSPFIVDFGPMSYANSAGFTIDSGAQLTVPPGPSLDLDGPTVIHGTLELAAGVGPIASILPIISNKTSSNNIEICT